MKLWIYSHARDVGDEIMPATIITGNMGSISWAAAIDAFASIVIEGIDVVLPGQLLIVVAAQPMDWTIQPIDCMMPMVWMSICQGCGHGHAGGQVRKASTKNVDMQ